MDEDDAQEMHDLVPLPQPERERTPPYQQTFSTLPDWIQNPVRVSATRTVSFDDLRLLPEKTVFHLKTKGFSNAFAVQTALLPRLYTPFDYIPYRPNDLCVSAPTGSGKTLGYALPIIENMKRRQNVRKLRAVVVVPTRELVTQALSTFTMCAAGSKLEIATSIGNQKFADEQRALVEKGERFDREGYERAMRRIRKRQLFEEDSDDDEDNDEYDLSSDKGAEWQKDIFNCTRLHVPYYTSKVDVLICTPGRLVEHIENTAGFSLEDVDWLIIDEADRLLDQSFQDWVQTVNQELDRSTKEDPEELDFGTGPRYVRRIILSATMTRDISQLASLKLQCPTMITVTNEEDTADKMEVDSDVRINDKGAFELPTGLMEYASPIDDGSEKPLYLLGLLAQILPDGSATNGMESRGRSSSVSSISSDSSEVSSSSSESSSGSSDESPSKPGPSSSDSDVSMSLSSSESESESDPSESGPRSSPSPKAGRPPQILIFASSTSEAHRLHHLLRALLRMTTRSKPTLTLLTRTQSSLSALNSSDPSRPNIIISTDRASRGLDLPLTHVVNYTIPRSLESYVHRVGRTARAGRPGEAWSLFSDKEGRWFWNEIARAKQVARKQNVERRKIIVGQQWEGGDGKQAYQKVLLEMSKMVDGEKKGKS
ncbi:DEAD/DEAH box helicase-like protein 1 [Elsinoe fawcettii]|nr:DEAD/DEAH box helicase-like protein 1 [Elsinoe fawcettii]